MSDHRARSLAAAVGLRTSLLISTLALTAHALFLYGQLVGREDDCPGAGRTQPSWSWPVLTPPATHTRRFISACRSFCVSHTKLARHAPPCASGSRSAAAPPVPATTDRDRLRAGFNNTGCDASVADMSDSMMEIDHGPPSPHPPTSLLCKTHGPCSVARLTGAAAATQGCSRAIPPEWQRKTHPASLEHCINFELAHGTLVRHHTLPLSLSPSQP